MPFVDLYPLPLHFALYPLVAFTHPWDHAYYIAGYAVRNITITFLALLLFSAPLCCCVHYARDAASLPIPLIPARTTFPAPRVLPGHAHYYMLVYRATITTTVLLPRHLTFPLHYLPLRRIPPRLGGLWLNVARYLTFCVDDNVIPRMVPYVSFPRILLPTCYYLPFIIRSCYTNLYLLLFERSCSYLRYNYLLLHTLVYLTTTHIASLPCCVYCMG